MRAGEIVVARLTKGATVVRVLETTSAQVTLAMGRNRAARVTPDRVVLETGLVVSDQAEVETFRTRCEALVADIDLAEVWGVVVGEPQPFSLDDLADLYWGPSPELAQKVALRLHLDRSSKYFSASQDGFEPRSREAVDEMVDRQRRAAEKAEAEASLMNGLADGRLPEPSTPDQERLIEHLRQYAVHGDDYSRYTDAHRLLRRVSDAARDLQRFAFDLLVSAGVLGADEPLELERYEVPTHFPDEAIAEARAVEPAAPLGQSHRRDLTSVQAITIDDAGTVDRDDALSVEPLDSGYRVGIHIADAGTLVPPGGAMDQEADRRMAAVYIPDGRIAMLPPDVTDEVGSLAPGEPRIALSLLVDVTESGGVLGWEVVPSVVASQVALSYEEADLALEETTSPWHRVLAPLRQTAEGLRQKRRDAGAIFLERPEMAIKVAASGQVDVRVLHRSSPARRLVTELMVLCNSLMADFCRREGLPAAYRYQDQPDVDELAPDTVAVDKVEASPLHLYRMMQRLPPAGLSTTPAAHRGLGVPAYIQVTSPLRRYPDLIMQRQISHYLSTGLPLYPPETVASVAQRAEVQLREIGRLEADRRRYWFLKYLAQSRLAGADPGDTNALFQAVVLDHPPGRHALLELSEYPFRLRAEVDRSRGPGDTVSLRLHEVDLWRRVARFVQERTG